MKLFIASAYPEVAAVPDSTFCIPEIAWLPWHHFHFPVLHRLRKQQPQLRIQLVKLFGFWQRGVRKGFVHLSLANIRLFLLLLFLLLSITRVEFNPWRCAGCFKHGLREISARSKSISQGFFCCL